MKTMRERWVGLVVSIRENKNRTGFWLRILNDGNNFRLIHTRR
jgi:hypothetical protein